MMTEPRFNTGNAVRVLLLLVMAFAGLIVASVFMMTRTGSNPSDLLLVTCVQDVLVFIVPAVACAMICYRHPWRLLAVDRAPAWEAIALVVAVWAVSLPALNWVVDWNQGLHLPASMAALEQAIRQMEQAAQAMTEQMLDIGSVPQLVASFLVIAVTAAVSEELFFRGALMGIMRQGRAGIHVVIWVVAVIFSAFHMQFLGFVPRLLLGAWLGYLLWWTRSLWVPVIAHTLNNGMVVIAGYLAKLGYVDGDTIDHLGVPTDGQFPVLALCSAVITTVVIALYARHMAHGRHS